MEYWDNNSCLGYCALAMKAAGYTWDDFLKVSEKLHEMFDVYTVEEAARTFFNTPWSDLKNSPWE